MFSYEFYKVLHLSSVFIVLLSLGGISLHMINGGTRDFSGRKWAGMFHGIGLAFALIGGFGLIARLYSGQSWPAWIHAKIAIWLVFGAMPTLMYRLPKFSKLLWTLTILIGFLASFLAVLKPF